MEINLPLDAKPAIRAVALLMLCVGYCLGRGAQAKDGRFTLMALVLSIATYSLLVIGEWV
jgi:hypothetical protein